MARRKKGFEYAEETYYFQVDGQYNPITIKRKSKEKAIKAYREYSKYPKDVTWLGKWNGKEFEESEFNKVAEAM